MRTLIPFTIVLLVGSAVRADDVPTFEKNVLPLLKDRCFSCHGADTNKAGLDVRTRASLLKGGRNGPALVPGSLKESHLWINVSTDKMPADKRVVSDAEKDMLRRWILAGAPGEGVAATVGKNRTTSSATMLTKKGQAAIAAIIDSEIARQQKDAKITPAAMASDAEYLRRVYLDLVGHIPSHDRTVAFLDSKEPDKRAKLVTELLASPEYGQQFATIWAKLITAEEPKLKPGLETLLVDRFNKNQPWDALVRDLVSANGTGPDTSFVMSNVDNKLPQPSKLAGSTARLFLGLQLQCAECHNHPFVDWKQTDFWSLAAFFNYTRLNKADKNALAEMPPAAKGKPEALPGAKITLPVTAGKGAGKVVDAKFLTGDKPTLPAEGPFRPALAEWMTAPQNPYFAPAAVNRLWAHFFGRGLVNPIDDLNDDNPPSHPEAMQALADEFRASGFDVKHLIECICATQAYQRSSRTTNADKDDEAEYARMAIKVMSPEALYDSLVLALEVKELNVSVGTAATNGVGGNSKPPTGKGAAREKFTRFFNTRELEGYATDYSHGIPQALALMNDPAMTSKPPIVDRLIKSGATPGQIIEDLFLSLLNRRPEARELKPMLAYVQKQSDPAKGYAGIVWVLINLPEFGLIR